MASKDTLRLLCSLLTLIAVTNGTALAMDPPGPGMLAPKRHDHPDIPCGSCKAMISYPTVPVHCHECDRAIHFYHACCTADYYCTRCDRKRKDTPPCSWCNKPVPRVHQHPSAVGLVCDRCQETLCAPYTSSDKSDSRRSSQSDTARRSSSHRRTSLACRSCGKPLARGETPMRCCKCQEPVHNSLSCYTRGFLCLLCAAKEDAPLCSKCHKPDKGGCTRRGSTGAICEDCFVKIELMRDLQRLRAQEQHKRRMNKS